MREQLRFVELEVRRRHHRDGIRARVGGVRRELDSVPGRLRPAVDGDEQAALGGFEEELRGTHALLDGQEEALSRRPERQQSVHPARREEVDVRGEDFLVERLSCIPQRCHSGGQCASQHASTLSSTA